MTKSNITVDAPCPLIKYTPDDAWTAAKQAQLPTTQVSLVLGASAEWTFNGTGIWSVHRLHFGRLFKGTDLTSPTQGSMVQKKTTTVSITSLWMTGVP